MSAPEVVDDNAPVETFDDNTEREVDPQGEQIKQGDLDGISEDNIIEGERSTRAKDFTGDDKLDQKVEEVSEADPGMN
ncbi:hypothetical protein OIO90_001014 [Microbotryomycetes sp. JL221]|nr:hypothetical protein OIO90_001014 [Microbotryomycetes sp. JL221]